MANDSYYVVEVRLPIYIEEALSVDEAARKAARIIENEYNVNISNWYLRVFEYGAGEEAGPIAEYFGNPAGSKFRKIDQNVKEHDEKIRNEMIANESSES